MHLLVLSWKTLRYSLWKTLDITRFPHSCGTSTMKPFIHPCPRISKNAANIHQHNTDAGKYYIKKQTPKSMELTLFKFKDLPPSIIWKILISIIMRFTNLLMTPKVELASKWSFAPFRAYKSSFWDRHILHDFLFSFAWIFMLLVSFTVLNSFEEFSTTFSTWKRVITRFFHVFWNESTFRSLKLIKNENEMFFYIYQA